jgi:hypothetical protein
MFWMFVNPEFADVFDAIAMFDHRLPLLLAISSVFWTASWNPALGSRLAPSMFLEGVSTLLASSSALLVQQPASFMVNEEKRRLNAQRSTLNAACGVTTNVEEGVQLN